MDTTNATRARRAKRAQFGLLYLMALVFTLVPHTMAWTVPKYLQARAAEQAVVMTGVAYDELIHGRLDNAVATADSALAADPSLSRAQAIKANALIERYWVTKSDLDLQTARMLTASVADSRLPETSIAQGNLALFDQNPARAVTSLSRAVELAPNDPYAQHQFGFALNQLNRTQDALGALRRALELSPDMAWVQANLQDVLTRLGRCEENSPRLKPEVIAGCSDAVGVARFNAGRYQEALRLFERAVAIAPETGAYHANLAVALLQLGERPRALKEGHQARALGVKEHPAFAPLGIR